ncbi:MAG: hypothetical protein HOP33_21160 [Verrucomicrobia bacterium]|nr:hypothetical protein [Verrucomicrobiota bacterium]
MIPTLPTPLKITSGLLLLLTVVAGCTTHIGYVIGEPRNGRFTQAADIKIVDSPNLHDYRVVGRVHAHSRAVKWLPWLLASQDRLLEQLKSEAALLHAEVIFDIKRYSRSQFEWQEEHLLGTTAIICNKEAGDAP